MIAGFRRLRLSQQLLLLTIPLPVLLIAALFLYAAFIHEGSLPVRYTAILIAALGLLLGYIIFAIIFSRRFSTLISTIGEGMTDLASGKFNGSIEIEGRSEIGSIAGAFNILKEDLRTKTEFAEQVKSGNLELAYRPANNTDRLGHALVTVRENLLRVSGEEEKRKWTAEGLARFAEVLRSNKNLKDLSNDIIINLAKVLKANQGAIFLINADDGEHDPVLNLEACYAYNRTKYFTRQIAAGEGLIGQAFLEKRTTYLKEVPANFIRITSGLGDAPPNHILIVPLKMNEDIVGVVELASFKEFPQHEIEFVEKIGESIAHSIISYRTAEHTKALLNESQARTEQLRSQEEELKQNQEELQATQEEISRKYDALFAKLTDLNHQSRFDQLRSITSTKKRNIEYYFDIIRNQIITFSEDRMIIEAVKAFRSAFRKIDEGISAEALKPMRQALKRYYTDEFIPRLNDNSDWIESVEHYLPPETKTSVLQYQYIAHNPHPTGKKSLLDDAGDGSEYSKMHATYHPVIRHFLEKFGYYDIFLLDPETGDMVYSVFKEVDFATSLLTGVYQKTNLGRW
jgi:GAF domain-containing protein/HAMP domain-containing protein